MDAFLSRKRRRISDPQEAPKKALRQIASPVEDESTDFKLAMLASLHPSANEETLLEALLASDGSVELASDSLTQSKAFSPRKKQATRIGHQSSLSTYRIGSAPNGGAAKKPLTKRGQTLFLYNPEDIEKHTPCSIIHNFLPQAQADALLLELVGESSTFSRLEFQLFERVVQTKSSFCFYVNSWDDAQRQKTEYIYDGRKVEDVRQTMPEMRKASQKVEEVVNSEIQRRIQDFYPGGKKLKYQSPDPWQANTAFVNCYAGAHECVGYHTDQLTYLGPRAVIGSLSLGVAREFRVRKILAEDDQHRKEDGTLADAQGQISIHLPHNSLLVMHAEMQEEWKHSIAPAQAIDPHPLSGNKRLNITYRCYKDNLHPKYTPKCKCGVPTVLRCCMRQTQNRGRYMWMCHTNYIPGEKGCSFFQWAEFDEDGNPPWASKVQEDLESQCPESEQQQIKTATD